MEFSYELKGSIKEREGRIDRYKVKFNSKEEAYELMFWLSFHKGIPVNHEADKWDFLSDKDDPYWVYLSVPVGWFIDHYHAHLRKGKMLGVPHEISEAEYRSKIDLLVEQFGELTYKRMYQDIDLKR